MYNGDHFDLFASAVRRRFAEMSAKDQLFLVNSDRETIWTQYLGAFPPGTNPLFRQRTEHDCSCCRHFIREVGNVVAIENGALSSIWDLNGLPSPYQEVADAMSEYVKSFPIRDVFLTPFGGQHGTPLSREMQEGRTLTWHHFSVDVPKKFVAEGCSEKQNDARTAHAVLLRGIAELTPDAVAAVADLISENAIYRGQEFEALVREFQQIQQRALAIGDLRARDLFAWTMITSRAVRFRNTVIGTLVQDISNGEDIQDAVRAYEAKVAPQNYKRPTALITKGMVQSAMLTIQELGLEEALERRHARLSDVSVSSVLFVDNAVQGKMKGGIEHLLMEEVQPKQFDPKKAPEIGIEDFIRTVLPGTTELHLYMGNELTRNFVSLTAPVHGDCSLLFRWSNDFAWSYEGNVADSIKDRVKRAGGKVDDVSMRISLAWFNTDDLDLHVIEPDGNHIFYGNKCDKLDVDMNVGFTALVRDPVENIRWIRPPRDGTYRVFVHNYTKRESVDVGFEVEVESASRGLQTFRFEKAIPAKYEQQVAFVFVKAGQVTEIEPAPGIVLGSRSQEMWGIQTLKLARVNLLLISPNYWDPNAVGNKHWFFILEGCKNPSPVRGIYNEFLHAGLQRHRKVFEVLGDKTKCPVADEQLSGVGFSSTREQKVTVVATGPALNRPYTIVFGKDATA